MNDLPNFKKEARYGLPAADQILYNRHYTIGYSYYFRQAKWALEVVDSGKVDLDRIDNFRPDYRIPSQFRADLIDYKGSGYDRGHLVASANQNELELQNSETFLLSNMSPQHPKLNRGVWRELESATRKLDSNEKIWETYVICGPVFYFNKPVESIGTADDNGVSIPIPNAYFKSVLTENNNGRIQIWSFLIDNSETRTELSEYLVPTSLIEQLAGIHLWSNLKGERIEKAKKRVRRMWK